jgi:hypothetical protein
VEEEKMRGHWQAAMCGVLCAALLFAGALLAAAAEEPASTGGEEMKGSARVPMEVKYVPAWLTWVSATTGSLKALGVECDTVDVAGYSGYAFVMVVHEELCPSGPTAFDWGMLDRGPHLLGRSIVSFRGAKCGGAPGDFRAAYDLAKSEIEAGRPVVVWGAYVPEFAIAVGVEDGSYLVKSFKPFTGEPEPPIPHDELQTPGGVYVLGFPSEVEFSQAEADRGAVWHAVEMIGRPSLAPPYATGLAAYDQWVAALEAGKADPFGNAYNAQCWAEAKRFAGEFLARLAARNESVAEPLGEAAAAYGETAAEMAKVAKLFPFPGSEEQVKDEEACAEAIAALRSAREAEVRAQAALRQSAQQWPRE